MRCVAPRNGGKGSKRKEGVSCERPWFLLALSLKARRLNFQGCDCSAGKEAQVTSDPVGLPFVPFEKHDVFFTGLQQAPI